jgi:hypothetical protein
VEQPKVPWFVTTMGANLDWIRAFRFAQFASKNPGLS